MVKIFKLHLIPFRFFGMSHMGHIWRADPKVPPGCQYLPCLSPQTHFFKNLFHESDKLTTSNCLFLTFLTTQQIPNSSHCQKHPNKAFSFTPDMLYYNIDCQKRSLIIFNYLIGLYLGGHNINSGGLSNIMRFSCTNFRP